jgi:hypothetical protein
MRMTRLVRNASFVVLVVSVVLCRVVSVRAYPILNYDCSNNQVFITAEPGPGGCYSDGIDECYDICQLCFGLGVWAVYCCSEYSDYHQIGCQCG